MSDPDTAGRHDRSAPAAIVLGRSFRPPESARTHEEVRDGAVRVVVCGELDIATSPGPDQSLCDAYSRASQVIVDLRAPSFMDGHGLSILVAAADGTVATDGGFRIVRGPLPVDRPLRLTGIDRPLESTASATT